MTGGLRTFGYLLVFVGAAILLGWFFEPLRAIWNALQALPLPLRVGGGVVGIGFAFILISLISERVQDHRNGADDPS